MKDLIEERNRLARQVENARVLIEGYRALIETLEKSFDQFQATPEILEEKRRAEEWLATTIVNP